MSAYLKEHQVNPVFVEGAWFCLICNEEIIVSQKVGAK